jgi:FkbM family methyltransferase
MASIVERLWNASPASLAQALRRRFRHLRQGEEWHRVAAGPAAGVDLLLPVPLEGWAREVADGTFDDFLYRAIARRRPLAGARCWDIGAHVGYHTLAFAAQGAHVVAFEPGGANAARFREHLKRNPALAERIRLVQTAVADRDGEMTFVESSDMTGASTGSHLAEATPPLRAQVYAGFERHAVTTAAVDTLIEQQAEPVPDIIKIDVEGAEHLVLQGGRRSLARHKPLLLLEVHHICVMFSVAQFLHELGYRTEILDRERATPSRCFVMAA